MSDVLCCCKGELQDFWGGITVFLSPSESTLSPFKKYHQWLEKQVAVLATECESLLAQHHSKLASGGGKEMTTLLQLL